MTNLALQIDQLAPPLIPESFSAQERRITLLALTSAKQQIRPYDSNFEASWLLTPFEAPIWETTYRSREEFVEGKWQNTIRIDWCTILPNGASLTDTRYKLLLTLIKKIAFLVRSGLVDGRSAPRAWLNATYILISVARWMVLHEERFSPEKYGLRLLDQPSLDWLLSQIAEGGWANALQIPKRLLATIYMGANGVTCPQILLDNPFTIPDTEIGALIQWLEIKQFYKQIEKGTHTGKYHLKRKMLARLINANPLALYTAGITSFLRQFEPDFSNESLVVSLLQPTEFPSQKAESIKDIRCGACSEASVESTATVIKTVLNAHRHIPDLLPEPAQISIRRATSIARRVARPSSHTLFMPVSTGLAYLNTAMRFVHDYGEAIVDFYLAVIAEYSPGKKSPGMNRLFRASPNEWLTRSGEQLATILNITEFRRWEDKVDFDRFRSNPTLDEALRVLIGSCIVCMALLKPSREEELTHLRRNCLREHSGGYWINFYLGKSNAGEAWQEEDRPIPVITARAIHLLQRLGAGLSTLLAEDRKVGNNLFYLPKAEGIGTLAANCSLLNHHLDIFCDFVGLPPDSEGRRWYVRIHEMRKWFLLLLFWSGRFDVLDAARWIAGHTDAQHIYAYIEKEFPGEELPQLEGEYSIDRVYRHEQERRRGDSDAVNVDGVDALYELVLRHFKVESLTMVPESEWTGYVLSLRKDERFRLEPHSIFGENGDVVGINVSFVMREVT